MVLKKLKQTCILAEIKIKLPQKTDNKKIKMK